MHTSSSPDSIDEARFVPGYVLAGRYRVAGLLGRGGMGEVYRADDLTLKQPVALKLLPESLSGDAAALERFRREVRVARQISHPNVCRVYDIGEAGGLSFLSMEFIRGEELASVIKRFGRLPPDKATEIARQVCAGLAAAHKAGVLHRDLKPANVMIDAAGEARVTDFGLAALAEEVRGDELAGTPAYMSPEQLAGKELTVKSDIYSLGLVLYELYTGKRAFDARTLPELLQLRKGDTTPTSPSALVKDLDPLVERVILRCLEADPGKRPASALEVAAALPGGDPLAAALAMGETPSPEMVAAAPKEGSLKPAVAASLLAAFVVGLCIVVWMSGRVMMHRQVPLNKSPEVLRERAAEIVRGFGYAEPPVDSANRLIFDGGYIAYVRENDRSPARWSKLRTGAPPVIFFQYRQSPRYLVPRSFWVVTWFDPPNDVSGIVNVALDTRGRLNYLRAVPQQVDDGQRQNDPPDWAAAFSAAGLDINGFKPAQSEYTPPDAYDTRAAWEGVFPEQPDMPVRIEAAGYRGRLTYFQIVRPWDRPERQQPYQPSGKEWLMQALLFVTFLLCLVGAVLLARRNLRLGRGDRKGAFRLALFFALLNFAYWPFVAHHVPTFDELDIFILGLAATLFISVMSGLLYLALEPFVRRRWPRLLISWNRLLAGDWRDPLVGRDVLVGAAAGVLQAIMMFCWTLAPKWLGLPPDAPYITGVAVALGGFGGMVKFFHDQLGPAVLFPLIALFVLLLFSVVLRRSWLVAVAGWLVFGLAASLSGNYTLIDVPSGLAFSAVFAYLFVRHGLLSVMACYFLASLCVNAPLTTDPSSWYFADCVVALAAALALALYGFYTSLAGQPLLRGGLLED